MRRITLIHVCLIAGALLAASVGVWAQAAKLGTSDFHNPQRGFACATILPSQALLTRQTFSLSVEAQTLYGLFFTLFRRA
jgi:hypothetical protein